MVPSKQKSILLLDLPIAVRALLLVLRPIDDRPWPTGRFWPVALLAASLGATYTVFSEWIVIPIAALWLARRSASATPSRMETVR